jgi:hypothetical protein
MYFMPSVFSMTDAMPEPLATLSNSFLIFSGCPAAHTRYEPLAVTAKNNESNSPRAVWQKREKCKRSSGRNKQVHRQCSGAFAQAALAQVQVEGKEKNNCGEEMPLGQ